jgi:hypothetical protein
MSKTAPPFDFEATLRDLALESDAHRSTHERRQQRGIVVMFAACLLMDSEADRAFARASTGAETDDEVDNECLLAGSEKMKTLEQALDFVNEKYEMAEIKKKVKAWTSKRRAAVVAFLKHPEKQIALMKVAAEVEADEAAARDKENDK